MTKPMLQWMVATLKPGNVLSSEELQQWQKILESDEALEVRCDDLFFFFFSLPYFYS